MTEKEPQTLAEWAVWYASHGFRVFPLVRGKKIPACTHGVLDATDDVAEIERAWSEIEDCNIGLAMGHGLVCIDLDVDVDGGEGGYEHMRDWELQHGDLPETWMSITGKGGMHIIYAVDEDYAPTQNDDYKIDIRGEGSYIVAPPSVHPNGTVYAWEVSPLETPATKADEKVIAFIEHIYPSWQPATAAKAAVSRTGGQSVHGAGGYSLPTVIKRGSRENTLFRYACQLQQFGYDDADIERMVLKANDERCVPPMPTREVIAKVSHVCSTYPKGERESLPNGITAASLSARLAERKAQREAAEADNGLAKVSCKKNGEAKPTIANALLILTQDANVAGRTWLDEFSGSKMLDMPVPWDNVCMEGSRRVTDTDYAGATAYAESVYGGGSKDAMASAFAIVAENNRRNPVREWLDGLTWDGEDHIAELLPSALGCARSEYNTAVMRALLHGAVSRVYEPGAKFDYVPLLFGAQGIGKSTFLQTLAPSVELYLDNLPRVDGERSAEMLRGKLIVELAEMAASKRARDVESIKAFVTLRTDTIHAKYARETEDRPRRCVFVATTNDATPLTDMTGNRRWLPVRCGVHKPSMWAGGEEFRQLAVKAWAQAVAEVKNGDAQLVLPRNLEKVALEMQQEFTEDDPRAGIIADYLAGVNADSYRDNKRVCAAEIIEKALGTAYDGSQKNMYMVNDIHKIMLQLPGWAKLRGRQRTRDYGVQTCYVPCRLEENCGIEHVYAS